MHMSDYYFTEQHQTFRQSLRSFLQKEVIPHIDQWEADGELPRSIWKQFGDMGCFGLNYPEAYGGLGLDFFYVTVMLEELCRCNSGGFAASIMAHPLLALAHINASGSEALKQKYLTRGIAGDLFGCLAVTEPGGGSDVAAIQTKAIQTSQNYIVNGSKTFITNGVLSDFLVVAVRTDPNSTGAAGLSLLVIDRDSPGLTATKLKKLGWHASDTGEISLDHVEVPTTNLLGEVGMGFYYIMQRFALERLVMAVSAIGSCEYALEYALDYMGQRPAFGRPLTRFQELRHRIAQLTTEVERARYFNYHLCALYQQGTKITEQAAMAKLMATELADTVTYQCIQFLGGYGYMEEYQAARMWRDARIGTIGGGSSEIMKEIIAKTTIDRAVYRAPVTTD